MAKEILIHRGDGETQVAIIENGRLDDYYVEIEQQRSLLGNIYKGKVESILPSINGAFVNIGQERNGFLYLTDAANPLIEEEMAPSQNFLTKILKRKEKNKQVKQPRRKEGQIPLKEGQEILVQVVKDPFGSKGARLTTHLSLAGRFMVYMPYDNHNGISKKIENQEERQRLKEIFKELTFARNGGFIIRTVSFEQGKRDLVRDAKFLYKIWQQILKFSEKKSAPALIYKEFDLTWRIIRDYMTDKIDKLLIDSQEDYHYIRKNARNFIGPELISKIQLYRAQTPLFKAKNVSKELEKIYDTRVFLKSGAHIVIEPTEGLTVVDVNSGKFKTKANPEEAAFMVNMEAAPDIARHLRLRDLGGIIVIDFIDMSREIHKRKVLEALQVALARDHAKTEVNRISSLGLVEMTRARTGKTVESLAFDPCPYCDGRGKIKAG